MLSLLPQILFLSVFSASLIRIAAAIMLGYSSSRHMARPGMDMRVFAVVEIALAAALFIGAWTQVVAIIATILVITTLISPRYRVWPRSTMFLLLIMVITLIVTGPGALAFDLPL